MKNFGFVLRISKKTKILYLKLNELFLDRIHWIIIMMIIKFILVNEFNGIFLRIGFFFLAVMNYRYAQDLKKITCEEFVPLFDKQQPHLKWTDVQV